jgi:hypothetical protein
LLSGAAAHFGGTDGVASVLYRVPPSIVDWRAIRTSVHLGAAGVHDQVAVAVQGHERTRVALGKRVHSGVPAES